MHWDRQELGHLIDKYRSHNGHRERSSKCSPDLELHIVLVHCPGVMRKNLTNLAFESGSLVKVNSRNPRIARAVSSRYRLQLSQSRMWSWMSCLSPSETSSTKDLSISSRNLLSPSMRITLLKRGSQCCKTAIDSGRHRCNRGTYDLSDLRKRHVFLKPQQQSLAIQRCQNLQPTSQTHCVLASSRGFEWGRAGEGNSSTAS